MIDILFNEGDVIMENVNITITNGTPLSEDNDAVLLTITVENENEIICQTGTSAFYYVTFKDNGVDVDFTFVLPNAGTIAADHQAVFVVEYTTTGPITDESGAIYYTEV